MGYSYRAYGLNIASEIEIFEFPAASGAPDMQIHLGAVDGAYDEEMSAHLTSNGVCFAWRGAGKICVAGGREIQVEPADDGDQTLFSHVIANIGMAVLLYQRGLFVLHASAVDLGGKAIAFIGESGAGKSTTAAAFQVQGFSAVSDDVVGVDLSGLPQVYPSFPQVKLLPDALETFGYESDALPLHHARTGKHILGKSTLASSGLEDHPLPLRAIFLLDRGGELALERMPPAQALTALFPNSYIARLRHLYGVNLVKALEGEAAHFRQIGSLIAAVPVFRLRRTFREGELAALPGAVLRHLEELA